LKVGMTHVYIRICLA